MQLPNDFHLCLPAEGLLPDFLQGLHETNPQMHPVVGLGSVIPFLQYELNVRGFRVDTGGGQLLPLSCMSMVVAPSGTGKSTTWLKLNALREAATETTRSKHEPYVHEGEIGLDGTTAGVRDALIELYDQRLNISPALLYADEISRTFAGVHARGSRSSDLPQFLNTVLMGVTAKSSLRKDKQGDGGSRVVVNPRVSGCGYTVQAALREGIVSDEMASTGFLARLLVLAVPDEAARMATFSWDRKPFEKAAWDGCVVQYMTWLNQLDLFASRGDTTITVSVDAQSVFRTLYEFCAEEFVQSSEALRSYLNRVVDKAAFVGALYASLRGSTTVEIEDAQPAMNVMLESFASLRTVVDDADIGNATDAIAKAADKQHQAALRALTIAGADGLMPSHFLAGHTRAQVLKRCGLGHVGKSVGEVERVLADFLEPYNDAGDALVTQVTPDLWAAWLEHCGRSRGRGRPANRYYLTEKLDAKLRVFLDEYAEGHHRGPGVLSIKHGTAWQRHKAHWEAEGWGTIPGRKAWKELREEAAKSEDGTFEYGGDRRRWPVELDGGSFGEKAKNPND